MHSVIFFVFVLLCFQGCDGVNKEQELKKVRVALAMQPMSALVMVAFEEGYFKKHGLDVVLSKHPSGKRALNDAILTGDADIASSSDVPIVKHAFKADDVVTIATIFSADNVNRVIARKDSGIKTQKDLSGKIVATQYASAVHFFLHLFLLENGLNESDMVQLFMKAEKLPKALAAKEIDAFSMREPYISQARELLGDNAIVFEAPGAYRQVENVITTKEYLKDNPKMIQNYIAALVEAESFVAKYPQKAHAIVAKILNAPIGMISANWDEFSYKLKLEQSTIILMEDISRWMIAMEIVENKKVPNFLNSMDTTLLKSYKPEDVTVIK